MKSLLQWKFLTVAGLTFKYPWLQSAAPVFQFTDKKIWVNNTANNIIGVRTADWQQLFPLQQNESNYGSNEHSHNKHQKKYFVQ